VVFHPTQTVEAGIALYFNDFESVGHFLEAAAPALNADYCYGDATNAAENQQHD
jgi:hypothetical protein